MIHLLCPVCGNAQDAADGKEFVFCKYCGIRMNVAEVAAQTAAAEAKAAAEETVQAASEAAQSAAEAIPEAAPAAAWPIQPETFTAAPEAEPVPAPQAAEPMPEAQTVPVPEPGTLYESITVETPQKKKSAKGLIIGLAALLLVLGGAAAAYYMILKPSNEYKAAAELMTAGEYADAAEAFEALGDYKDAREQADACYLQKALEELKSGKYSRSVKTLRGISDEKADLSAFDKAANEAVSALIRQGETETALQTIAELSGHAGDVTAAVRERFAELMGSGDRIKRNEAGSLLISFQDELTDTSFVPETVKKTVSDLIGAGEYYGASSLLNEYDELKLDVNDAVMDAFKAQLEQGDNEKLFNILTYFSEYTKDLEPYRTAVSERLTSLVESKDFDAAVDLYYAAQDLGSGTMLTEAVSTALDQAVDARDPEAVNALTSRFRFYTDELDQILDSRVMTAVDEMIGADQLDEALAFLAKLDDYYFPVEEKQAAVVDKLIAAEDFDKALAVLEDLSDVGFPVKEKQYAIAKALAGKGQYEEAAKLFEELGHYEDSEELLKAIRYAQLKEKIAGLDDVLAPEEMAALYKDLVKMGDYEDAKDQLDVVIRYWFAYVWDGPDRMAQAEMMNQTVDLNDEQKDMLLNAILAATPILCGYNSEGVLKYRETEPVTALLTLMIEQYGSSGNVTAYAFMDWLYYLTTLNDEDLPTIEDVEILWPLRSDMQDFCTDYEPLMLFLVGDWVDENQDVMISMTSPEAGRFSLNYEYELESTNGYMKAEDFGLSLVDENGELVCRICDITIVGLNVIELTNGSDGEVHTLTRMTD